MPMLRHISLPGTGAFARLVGRACLALAIIAGMMLADLRHNHTSPDRAQAAAYLLAGGDWADICADTGAPGMAADRCMACLAAGGVVLAAASAIMIPAPAPHLADWRFAAALRAPASRATVAQARAPPVALIPSFT